MSKHFVLTEKEFEVEAKPKDIQPMVDKFKQYLLDNLNNVKDVKVFVMPDDVKAKQAEVGVTGHTHVFVCEFELGMHVVSINARKNTIRGWKKNIEYIEKSYETYLKDIIKSIK